MAPANPVHKNVRAVLKNTTQELKNEFKTAQCLLLISVGQESHEGDRFAATMDLVNDSFNSCVISLYDSLQRYTMALNSEKGPDDFYALAVKEGDLWLERNEKYYNQLTVPLQITRSNIWLLHPNYFMQKNKIKEMTDQDPTYKAIFDDTINKYLNKYTKRLSDLSDFNYSRAQLLCFNYILEECAVLCLWSELQCQFEIYPGQLNAAMEETRRRFIFPKTPDLMIPMQFTFRNVKKMKPQKFEVLN